MLGQANGVSVDHNEVNVDTDAEVDVPTTVVESPPQSAGYQSADPPASGDPGALTTVGSDQQGERTSAYSATDYEVQQAVACYDVPVGQSLSYP